MYKILTCNFYIKYRFTLLNLTLIFLFKSVKGNKSINYNLYSYYKNLVNTLLIFSAKGPTVIGGKGLEPSIVKTIEFTAQPVIPTNGTLLKRRQQ